MGETTSRCTTGGVGVGEGVGVGLGEGVGVGLREGDGLGVEVGVGLGEGDGLGEAVPVVAPGLGSALAVAPGLAQEPAAVVPTPPLTIPAEPAGLEPPQEPSEAALRRLG